MLIVVRRMLVSLDFKKTSNSSHEWTESFEVIIERESISEISL